MPGARRMGRRGARAMGGMGRGMVGVGMVEEGMAGRRLLARRLVLGMEDLGMVAEARTLRHRPADLPAEGQVSRVLLVTDLASLGLSLTAEPAVLRSLQDRVTVDLTDPTDIEQDID